MEGFFAQRLDLVIFFYGAAFVFLGSLVWGVSRQAPRVPGGGRLWLLGVFALTHGLGEWVNLLGKSLGKEGLSQPFHFVLIAASMIFFFEFGRRSLQSAAKQWLGFWLTLIPVAPVAYALLTGGFSEGSAFARYLWCLPGGLLATIGVIRQRHLSSKTAAGRSALFLGVSLLVFTIAEGAVVPQGALWPANRLNEALFLSFTGFPIQFVRALLAVALGWSFFRLLRVVEPATEIGRRLLPLGRRIILDTALASACIFLLTVVGTEVTGFYTSKHIKRDLKQLAIASSLTMDEFVPRLEEARGTERAEALEDLSRKMRLLKEANPSLKAFFFLLAEKEGVLLRSEPPNLYTQAQDEIKRAMALFHPEDWRNPFAAKIVIGRENLFLWAPVRTSGDEAYALVGFAAPRSMLAASVSRARLSAIGICSVLFLLAIGAGFYRYINLRERLKSEALSEELSTRVRQLTCLYRLGWLLERAEEVPSLLEEVSGLLPPAMQFPEAASARIVLDGTEYPAGIRPGSRSLSSPIVIDGSIRGEISLFYQEERNFTTEEESLLKSVAERLGRFLQERELTREVEQSRQRFMALVGNIPGAVYQRLADENQTIFFISPFVKEIAGYPPEDFLYNQVRSYMDIVLPDDRASLSESVRKAARSDEDYSVEYRITDSSGRTRYILDRGRGVKDSEGNLLYLDGVLFDISRERNAIEALRDSEERYRKLLQSASDAIVVADPGTRMIEETNPEFFSVFGFSQEEAKRLRFEDLVSSDRRREFLKEFEEVLKGKSDRLTGVPLVKKSGERFICDISASLFRVSGTSKIQATFHDVTERMRTQEQLKRSAERLEQANLQLEEASRLKSEFLANTSHELKTPLNAVLGYLSLVLDGIYDNPEEERSFIESAFKSSKQLLNLINDILEIAKIEAGRLDLNIEPVEMKRLFEEVRHVIKVPLKEKNLSLEFDLPDDLPPVRADYGRLRQILLNLLSNSIKFTEEGFIKVSAEAFPVRGYVEVKVSDTGIGVPREKQRFLFRKFVQADGSSTRRHGGTGLGLAISKSLVEMMGGVIELESPGSGQGTKVSFTIPIFTEEVPAAEVPGPRLIEGAERSPLVLVVEGNRRFREHLGRILSGSGLRWAGVSSAQRALLALRRLPVSAMTLDVALPSESADMLHGGWDLLREMRKDSPLRRIPTIVVTGFVRHVRKRLSLFALPRPGSRTSLDLAFDAVAHRIRTLAEFTSRGKVFVVLASGDTHVRKWFRRALSVLPVDLEEISRGNSAVSFVLDIRHPVDMLLLDLALPDKNCIEVIKDLRLLTGLEIDIAAIGRSGLGKSAEERTLFANGTILPVIGKESLQDQPEILIETVRSLQRGVTLKPS